MSMSNGQAKASISMGVLRNGQLVDADGAPVEQIPVAQPRGRWMQMSEGAWVFVPNEQLSDFK